MSDTPKNNASLIPASDLPPQNGQWIIPGMYFQGEDAPKSPEWRHDDWVEIPHEHYIPISKSRFNKALFTFPKTEKSSEKFGHFLDILEGLYHFYYHRVMNELKEDYEFFAPDTGAKMREGLTEAELIRRERRFLTNFLRSMKRGNFNPFNEEEYTRAVQHSYLFDLPVSVNWEAHDPRMIQDFLSYVDSEKNPEARQALEIDSSLKDYLQIPQAFENSCFVFHRGIERDETKGGFLLQKIDFLLSRIFGIFTILFQKRIEWYRGDKFNTTATTHPTLADKEAEASKADSEEERSTIFQRRWLRRMNVRSQPKAATKLFAEMTLQEPAIQRVIALFRLRLVHPPKLIERLPWLKKLLKMKTPAEGEVDWTVHIKMFKNIPLADAEIIFPEKRIHMKSFDVAMLFLTALGGLFALWRSIAKGGNAGILALVLTVLGAYIAKIIVSYRRTKQTYIAKMTADLYNKNLDNNIGVLQYLVDTLEEQEYKEAILAYHILWEAGEPLTAEEVDERAESFLKEKFEGLEVDFEVDDALDKVIEKESTPKDRREKAKYMPLVRVLDGSSFPDGQTRYEAKPLQEALRLLDETWDGLYGYSENDEG